jgi:hypothetical protein
MEPALSLLKHDRLRRVEHCIGDLFTAVGGEAMHKTGVWWSLCHERPIYLIPFKGL